MQKERRDEEFKFRLNLHLKSIEDCVSNLMLMEFKRSIKAHGILAWFTITTRDEERRSDDFRMKKSSENPSISSTKEIKNEAELSTERLFLPRQ